MVNQRHPISGSLSTFGNRGLLRELHRLRDTKQVLSTGRKTCQKSLVNVLGEAMHDSVLWKAVLDVSTLLAI